MKKVINCIKEFNPVINRKLRKVSVDEGLKIAEELFRILNERKDGIGLAANQVGIDASVAVVNVREPLILINPVITEQWDEIEYYEGCLSYPKRGVQTKRYKNIIIQTEQEESGWYFSGAETTQEVKGTWEEEGKKQDQEQRILEAICVQHEIDHLNGMTIHDRENKPKPIRVKKSWGRNEIVGITDGKDYKEIKYKKAKPLLDSGKWVIYVGGPIT
jgi:peptide deformylase